MKLELSDARAGLVDIGNIIQDLHFEGGQIAIDTRRSAPGWPIAVVDCTFENQRVAAIRTYEAGLAIVRPTVRNVPAAVVMAPGTSDELWISDGRFENIAEPAIAISRPRNACTQVGIENVACRNVPVFAALRDTGYRATGPGSDYVVDGLTHGLHLGSRYSPRAIATTVRVRGVDTLPAPVPSDVPALPPPSSWANVRTLGVAGDGKTDDTEALRAAIAEHRTLYFPMGWYTISDTLTLREDTVLVGLHPARTVINLPNDAAAFVGDGAPKPLIAAPQGGTNIVTGLGVYTGERNPRAVAVWWQAGESALLDDVRFHGGHGTRVPDRQLSRYGDREHWNTQPASLWVGEGGGGTIRNIWTPNPHARTGLHIANTTTPGRVYAMSVEHHVDHEAIVENAANWQFFGLQFEAEREEGPEVLPLKIEGCNNLLFANTFCYRVVSSFVPAPFAITVADSSDIRFRNVHVYSNSKVSFDSAVYDADNEAPVRDSEFAVLDLPVENPTAPATVPAARVTMLADGFHNIAGAAVAPDGDVYFADARKNRVYRWSHERQSVQHVRDIPERPEQLAFDRAGNLLVIAYEGYGTVLAFDPTLPDAPIQTLAPHPAALRPDGTPILPVTRWTDDASFLEGATAEPFVHYLAPDGTTFIPAGKDFAEGATSWGVKLDALLRTFGVAPAPGGHPFYVTNELGLRTYAFEVRPDGSLANPRLLVEEGGECVTTDVDGNVYLAAGQIQVFTPAGRRIGVIAVPRRPTGLVFGGPERRTLYVTARDALYAVTFE